MLYHRIARVIVNMLARSRPPKHVQGLYEALCGLQCAEPYTPIVAAFVADDGRGQENVVPRIARVVVGAHVVDDEEVARVDQGELALVRNDIALYAARPRHVLNNQVVLGSPVPLRVAEYIREVFGLGTHLYGAVLANRHARCAWRHSIRHVFGSGTSSTGLIGLSTRSQLLSKRSELPR